ncbi:triose-phosphate isomerase [bacterium]|nr:triose-phosphate isomerase [bacterium]
MRIPLIVGNWKMNMTGSQVSNLLEELKTRIDPDVPVDVGVVPSFPYLSLAAELLVGSNIKVGAQNMSWEVSGAFTGEVSPMQIRDTGCSFVILGHSERRHIFGETDEMINNKIKRAVDEGLNIILCVGEKLKQREDGKTEDVIDAQLNGGLKDIDVDKMDRITIAYEPVWAIGTGKTATPEMAQAVHAFIRNWLNDVYGSGAANDVRIQYGGSVKPENSASLMVQNDIDGALIGGASLDAEKFAEIVYSASGNKEE